MGIAPAPFLQLVTARTRPHFHTGTMTRRVVGPNKVRGEERVEIRPLDAGRLGIADRDVVRVPSCIDRAR